MVSVVRCGPAHSVGRFRNGLFVCVTAVPPPVQIGRHDWPRSASCPGADGTPQNVSLDLRMLEIGAVFATVVIVKNSPASVVSRTPPTMSVRGARIGIANAKSETSLTAGFML